MILFTYYIVFILAIWMFHVYAVKSKIVIESLYDIYRGENQEQKLPYILNFYLKDICALEIYFVKRVKLNSVALCVYFWQIHEARARAKPSIHQF